MNSRNYGKSMRYTCRDIEQIILSDLEDSFDQAGFWEHLESCASCRQYAQLEPDVENELGLLLPYPAPETLSSSVMRAIRLEAKQRNVSVIFRQVRLLLVPAIYILTIIIGLVNLKAIKGGLGSAAIELSQVPAIYNYLGFSKDSFINGVISLAASPLLIATLIGVAVLLWSFSIIKLREISK
jgi:predicted anti-sigma-YlaC factor YlaD